MDDKELNEKWDEMLKKTFQQFIEENVGYMPESLVPKCHGSGDNKSVCPYCGFQSNC